MYKIVFLRHGHSKWNEENRFTGWTDVDLSKQGIKESHYSGQILLEQGFKFDIAFYFLSASTLCLTTSNIIIPPATETFND